MTAMTIPRTAPGRAAAHPAGDLMAARPRLRADVVLGAAQQRGHVRMHHVRVLGTGRTLEVGPKEHFVMALLDGTRTLEEIGAAYQARFGTTLAPANWQQILGVLYRSNLVAVPTDPAPAARPRLKGGRHALRLPRTPGRPRTVRVVRTPDPLLDGVLGVTRAAFSRWLVLPVLLTVAAMEVVLATRIGDLAEQTGRLLTRPGPLMLAALVSWLLSAAHELAHGVAARRYGVRVLEIGVRWLPPLVMPYCRTDGYLYLPRRRAHVVIAGSGVLVQLVLLLPAFAAWYWGAPTDTTRDTLAAILLWGSGYALLNLAPVPPLDGYKVLSHALGISDYARQTAVYLALLGRRDPRTSLYPRPARIAYLAYGLGTVAATVGTVGLALVAAYAWLGGWLGAASTFALLAVALAWAGTAARRRLSRGRHAAGAPPGSTAPHGHGSAPSPAAVAPAAPSGSARLAPPPPASGTHRSRGGDLPVRDREPREVALLLDGVVKAYGGRRAVDGVRLEVATGEFLGLLGPNGAGKTTLVEIAVGLRQADSGSVSVLGQAPWPRRTSLLRRIGVQTQSAAFFTRLTAREHLRVVAELYGVGPDGAEEALHLVGLGGLGETRADRLSGGQQQRLAIATALVHDPEIVFLDEPTASLDPQARRELWAVLRDLHAGGRTIVYTTHHIDEAEALCTRVAVMSHGAVVASGAPYELIDAAALPTRLVVPRAALSLDAVRTMPRVASATVEGPSVVVETHDPAGVAADLAGVAGIRGVQTRPPTLEDVYLHLVRPERVP